MRPARYAIFIIYFSLRVAGAGGSGGVGVVAGDEVVAGEDLVLALGEAGGGFVVDEDVSVFGSGGGGGRVGVLGDLGDDAGAAVALAVPAAGYGL